MYSVPSCGLQAGQSTVSEPCRCKRRRIWRSVNSRHGEISQHVADHDRLRRVFYSETNLSVGIARSSGSSTWVTLPKTQGSHRLGRPEPGGRETLIYDWLALKL